MFVFEEGRRSRANMGIPRRSPQSSHKPGNLVALQRIERFLFTKWSLKIFGCPMELGHSDRSGSRPGGTTESSPALQCRVKIPSAARPGGTLEALGEHAFRVSSIAWGECAVHSVVATIRALQASLRDAQLFSCHPALKCRATFNRPSGTKNGSEKLLSYGMAVSTTWERGTSQRKTGEMSTPERESGFAQRRGARNGERLMGFFPVPVA